MASGSPDYYIGITNIRDLIWEHRSLIQNPMFAQHFVGWEYEAGVDIVAVGQLYNFRKSCRFKANQPAGSLIIYQCFPTPLGVDWFTELSFMLRADQVAANHFKVRYYYIDGTLSDEFFSTATANVWEKKTMNPTAGKYIKSITFSAPATYAYNIYLGFIAMVF